MRYFYFFKNGFWHEVALFGTIFKFFIKEQFAADFKQTRQIYYPKNKIKENGLERLRMCLEGVKIFYSYPVSFERIEVFCLLSNDHKIFVLNYNLCNMKFVCKSAT